MSQPAEQIVTDAALIERAIRCFDAAAWTCLILQDGGARARLAVAERVDRTASGPARFDEAAGIANSFLREGAPPAYIFASFFDEPGASHDSMHAPALVLNPTFHATSDGSSSLHEFGSIDRLARRTTETTKTQATNEASASEDEWQELVRQALQEIQHGNLSKVVVARSRQTTLPDIDEGTTLGAERLVALLIQLSRQRPDATTWALRSPDGQTFLGASPELLVRQRQGRVETMALAGTVQLQDTGKHSSHDATTELKNRREHELVREDIVAKLRSLKIDAQSASAADTVAYGDIAHLRTTIGGENPGGVPLLHVVDALHPTPAVCGTPLEASASWLAKHEQFSRGLYAGPFGWVDSNGDGEFHVALRCAFIQGDQATLYAGAGIVTGSDPALEWAETGWKLSTMASALGTADQIEELEHSEEKDKPDSQSMRGRSQRSGS